MNLLELWSFAGNEPILGIELGDVNGDGRIEIVANTKEGKLLIFSEEGKLLLEEEVSEKSSNWCVSIWDIDKDHRNEIILGGLDGLLRVFKCDSTCKLEALWAHQFGASIGGILVDDINNDNKEEIIAYSLDKTVRVLSPFDGSLVWGQVFEQGVGDAKIWTDTLSPSKKELIAGGNDGTMRVFDGYKGDLLWFKRFSDKVRCVSFLKSSDGIFFVCGGDDKQLHVINKDTKNEVKTLEFQDYVWKCASYPSTENHSLLVSTYSFAYFDDSVPIEKINFTSKLMNFSNKIDEKWELNEKNIESLTFFEKNRNYYIAIGTTSGDILVLDSINGNILTNIKKYSCVNSIRIQQEQDFIISCHDNGTIFAYKIEL